MNFVKGRDTYKKIWELLVKDVNEKESIYVEHKSRRMSAADTSTAIGPNNDSDLISYKTIQGDFLSDQSGNLFLSLNVGNLFSNSSNLVALKNDDLYTIYSQCTDWINAQSSTNLDQSLAIINKFIS